MSYLCVDGGQTKTEASLLDEDGLTVESWKEGPLTTPSKPGAADDLRAVVRRACEELERRLTRRSLAPPEAACFSLTGYLERADGAPPTAVEGRVPVPALVEETVVEHFPEMARVHTIPDYVGNWAAATGGAPGIMVLSGGGTVAYGRDASGKSLRVGGWGHLLGDEGSGYWIGLEAIRAALRSWAGTAPKTDLEEALTTKFRVGEDRQLIEKVYSGDIPDAEIAGLVPLVDSLAERGDDVAARILGAAAAHLAGMGAAMLAGLGELPVHLSGGVFRAAGMEERFRRLLREAGHGAEVFPRSVEPSEGILLIAKGGAL